MKRNSSKTPYHCALVYLTRREHSCQEVHVKLKQKGFATADITEALERLVAEGALSDRRFADSYIRARGQQGYGPFRILQELKLRGVAATTAAEALRASEQDWPQLAKRVTVKKFGEKEPASWEEKAKQRRFLEYRGFET